MVEALRIRDAERADEKKRRFSPLRVIVGLVVGLFIVYRIAEAFA
jgi:hypothetical protein